MRLLERVLWLRKERGADKQHKNKCIFILGNMAETDSLKLVSYFSLRSTVIFKLNLIHHHGRNIRKVKVSVVNIGRENLIPFILMAKYSMLENST